MPKKRWSVEYFGGQGLDFYLEDGQTLPHFPDWQQCPTEAWESGLSALFSSVRALEMCGESHEADSAQLAWAADRTALCSLGGALTGALPRAEGFFVGEEERARAHAAVCRFYTLAEPHFERLRNLSAQMRALLDRTRNAIMREDGMLREVTLAKHASDRVGDPALRARISEIAETLYRIREQNTALRRRLSAMSDMWILFCNERFPAITARIGSCADLEHEGRACDPRALSVLCAELAQMLGEPTGNE